LCNAEEHALLNGHACQRFVDVFCGDLIQILTRFQRQLRGHFKRVVGVAAVAARVAGNQFQRIVIRGQSECAKAPLAIFKGTAQQRCDLFLGQRLQHVDAAAREQRGDDFEGGILSCRSNQPYCPALHVGQKGVLLGLVEAVNLIDEEDGAGVHLRRLRGRDHHLLDFLDAACDGGEFNETCFGCFGDDLGQRGLAHARRTPEDHGAGIIMFNLDAQWLAGADQVLLSAQLLQAARAHAFGQRRGARQALRTFGFAVKQAHRNPPRWSRGPPLKAERCRDAS
jgi:hypothetical protein